jgi:hypothetical protein
MSNRSVASEGGFVARHSLPRGRHVLLAPVQPVDRPTAGGVHGVVGSSPVRRGIAVAAVVGGALSAAGIAVAPGPRLPDPADSAPVALELSARSTSTASGDDRAEGERADDRADRADDAAPRRDDASREESPRSESSREGSPRSESSRDDASRDDASRSDASRDDASRDDAPVLDPAAVARTVRQAAEEGKRLAEKDRAEKDKAEKDKAEKAEKERAESDPGTTASASAATGAAPPPARGGATASQFPGELIDTNEWYLTLPTGQEGKPDTIDGADLARYHSKFFALNESRDGIVFTANAGGATTSGSKYPRSELREMNGTEKASWDGRKGTHTMELDQAITATPGDKPDVIAGQIHATSDDLMQIHLSGTQLTVKYADGKEKVVLDEDYRLGKRFTTKIESSGGRVKVWYDGQQKADLAINSPTSYFKAGAYVNSNTGNGESASAVGQVVIYRADVTHS